MSDYGHPTNTKSRSRISPVNVVFWVLGGILMIAGLLYFGSIFGALIGIPAMLIGWPIPGDRHVFRWLYNRWLRYRNSKRNAGFLHRRNLLRDSRVRKEKEEETPWDKFSIIKFKYLEKSGKIRERVFLWTPGNNYLTVPFKIQGYPGTYVDGDGAVRWGFEEKTFHQISQSMQTAPPKTTVFGLTTYVRPADPSQAYDGIDVDANPDIREALDGNVDGIFVDKEDERLALNVAGQVDQVHDGANRATERHSFAFLRVPFPRRLGKRLSLDQPKIFTEHKTNRLITRFYNALVESELEPSYMTQADVVRTIVALRNVRTLDDFYYRADNDRRRVEEENVTGEEGAVNLSLDDTETGRLERNRPNSSRFDRSGMLIVDGTGLAAGFVDEIHSSSVSTEDLESALGFSDTTFWALTLLCVIESGKMQRHKGREVERARHIANSMDESWNAHLSDPQGEQAMAEAQSARQTIANAGNRTASWSTFFTLASAPPEEIEEGWEEASAHMMSLWRLQRMFTDEEISDLQLGHFGVVAE